MKTAYRRTSDENEGKTLCEEHKASLVVMDGKLFEKIEIFQRKLIENAKLASKALIEANIPHAVIGGLAVAVHVAQAVPGAERGTRDVNLLLNRSDLQRCKKALQLLGFCLRRRMAGLPSFLPKSGRLRDGIRFVLAGEKISENCLCPAPLLTDKTVFTCNQGFICLNLPELLIMKLNGFRYIDITHIQDLMDVELISQHIKTALPPELRKRMTQVEEITKQERSGLNL